MPQCVLHQNEISPPADRLGGMGVAASVSPQVHPGRFPPLGHSVGDPLAGHRAVAPVAGK